MAFSPHLGSATPMQADGSSSSTPSRRLSHHVTSSFRASPSPSATSQSDDPDRDDEEEEDLEDEDEEYTDAGSSTFPFKERRNTLKARGSAALPATISVVNSSENWQMMPANARNASAATLPHEILLHIFKYVSSNPSDLRRSLTVCKAWCLCGVELLWHRPSFHRISNLFKMIHIIRQSNQTFPYATFVRRLSLSGLASDLEDSLFSRLVACTRLERLTLTGCTFISDDAISVVLSQLKHLVAADFSDVEQLTDKSIMMIAQNCPRLQGINFSGCKEITSNSIAVLARNCKLLRRVKLCGCELVGDEGLAALAQNCPVLLEVDLINCPLITDYSVREMWKNSFHMRELRLAQCGKLTDLAFPAPNSAISEMGAANLMSLGSNTNSPRMGHISDIQPRHFQSFLKSESAPVSQGASPMSAARDVEVNQASSSSSSPNDNGYPRTSSMPTYEPLHSHLRSIRMLDHLRILDLTNCNTISDAAIDGIVSNVPRLRNLILAKCTRLTNESVYSISRLGKNLHYLHLGHVSNLTDRAVCHLARSCTRLRYIDLACCPQLTDLSVLELAANLPKLRRVGLVRVTNLTDQAIYSLVERYTSLERIHLSYCENVSVPAIFWLLERLSRLTHLSLTGVPAFRKPELQAMCREPPREFNAHQRSAFCVYSGKGVHELRKFLQSVYSGDETNILPFGHLTPEVQRARNNLAEGRTDRRQHHSSRHATPSDASSISRGIRGEDQRHLERSATHHLATRSDPHFRHQQQQQQPFAGTMLTTGNIDASVGSSASNRRPITSEGMQLDHRGSRRWETEAMDEDDREWRDDENDEIGASDHAARTPTATFPPSAFSFGNTIDQRTSRIGPPFVDAISTHASSMGQGSDRIHFGPAAFTGTGRRLGEAPNAHRLGDPVNLTALATPPLTIAEDFFRNNTSSFRPGDSQQRQLSLFTNGNNDVTSNSSRQMPSYSSVIRDEQTRLPISISDRQTPRPNDITPPTHPSQASSSSSSTST